METTQEIKLIYKHCNPKANWRIVEWEEKKFTALTRHYTTTNDLIRAVMEGVAYDFKIGLFDFD